jgi:hypothetical protein
MMKTLKVNFSETLSAYICILWAWVRSLTNYKWKNTFDNRLFLSAVESFGFNIFWTRTQTRIWIMLLIFSRNIFLCLHLVIALEIQVSSFPLICIVTSAPDTYLRQSWREFSWQAGYNSISSYPKVLDLCPVLPDGL